MAEPYLCDEMLGGLARLLRAAGHDAQLASPGTPDADLLVLAEREGRLLLTRDRALARRAGARALLLASGRTDEQAVELGRSGALDWQSAPFTRCLIDNEVLRQAPPDVVARAPISIREGADPFRVCPACGRVYWPGSHVRRMSERLRRVAEWCR